LAWEQEHVGECSESLTFIVLQDDTKDIGFGSDIRPNVTK